LQPRAVTEPGRQYHLFQERDLLTFATGAGLGGNQATAPNTLTTIGDRPEIDMIDWRTLTAAIVILSPQAPNCHGAGQKNLVMAAA
jgi:hypothetical protein